KGQLADCTSTKGGNGIESLVMKKPSNLYRCEMVLAIPGIYFITRCKPYIIMAGDIIQSPLQVLGTKRLPSEKGMHNDRHEPRIGGAFGVQHVKLIDNHVTEGAC